MADLPEDLDRLGHVLTRAAERAVVRRRRITQRRKRLLSCALAATLAFATFAPTHLGSADQSPFLSFAIQPAGAATRCDQPRGQSFHYTEACDIQEPAPQAAR